MKEKKRFLQNLILTMVLVGGMLGVYLYAGHQERVSAAAMTTVPSEANSTPMAAVTQTAAPAPDVSGDGRRKDSVLKTFSDAGYVLVAQSEERVLLTDADGITVAEAAFSLQGDRVHGLVLSVPLPKRVEKPKDATPIEQKVFDQYDAGLKKAKETLPNLLDTALLAIDPYETVPLTARMYWKTLAAEALEEEREASDASEAIRLRIYFSETKKQSFLCLSLQQK